MATGGAHREHLVLAAKAGNQRAAAALAAQPDLPEPIEYVWDWWEELSAGRAEGFSGPAPLSWLDIDAWARRTDRDPKPHEIWALFLLDATMRAGWRKKQKE